MPCPGLLAGRSLLGSTRVGGMLQLHSSSLLGEGVSASFPQAENGFLGNICGNDDFEMLWGPTASRAPQSQRCSV